MKTLLIAILFATFLTAETPPPGSIPNLSLQEMRDRNDRLLQEKQQKEFKEMKDKANKKDYEKTQQLQAIDSGAPVKNKIPDKLQGQYGGRSSVAILNALNSQQSEFNKCFAKRTKKNKAKTYLSFSFVISQVGEVQDSRIQINKSTMSPKESEFFECCLKKLSQVKFEKSDSNSVIEQFRADF